MPQCVGLDDVRQPHVPSVVTLDGTARGVIRLVGVAVSRLSARGKQTPLKMPAVNRCADRNMSTVVHSGIFATAERWEQPRCPSAGEWINNVVRPHTGILLSREKEGGTDCPYHVGGP